MSKWRLLFCMCIDPEPWDGVGVGLGWRFVDHGFARVDLLIKPAKGLPEVNKNIWHASLLRNLWAIVR